MAWSYEDDFILLDENITTEEKRELYQDRQYVRRIRFLKRLKLDLKKVKKEKQQIIDIYPDYNMTDISKHLHQTQQYIATRVNDLREQGLLRGEPLLTKEQKEYIKRNRHLLKTTVMANKLDLPLNLVKMVVSEEYRKRNVPDGYEKVSISKKDKMPRKMQFKESDRPKDALDKRIVAAKKYKDNQLYEIKMKTDTRKNESNVFKGVLIYQNKDYITLRHELGYKESFNKVDFETGDKEIKEVAR
ncbi:MAG: MarR family transcriptional regulator [Tissierella sp.]|nr:MarR family transcriptional regulator [Tissierella sp.]